MKYQALRPTFSLWWMVGGFLGWVGGRVVVGWIVGWVVVGWVMGWVGVGLVGLGVMGGWGYGVVGPHDTPHHGGLSDAPMLFFDNLVKKLDQIVKK